jgi:hypothetical protein
MLVSRAESHFSNTSSETYPCHSALGSVILKPCCVVSNLILCQSEAGRRRAGDGPETGRRWAGDGPETGRRLAGDGAIPGIGLDVGLSNRIHPDKEAISSGVGSHRARSKIKCGIYDCDPTLWNSYPTLIEPQRTRYIFL